jgi:ABC-type transport system substrate-binding protein
MGLANPRVDELLEEGVATYDQRERTRIYHELQRVFAEERLMLFAWADNAHEHISTRLGSVDGELNFVSREWPWELEKLVLR